MKRIAILISLMCLFVTPVFAGVDQNVYGSEALHEDGPHGMDQGNGKHLYGNHGTPNVIEDDPTIPLDPNSGTPAKPSDQDHPDDNAPVPEPATGLLLGLGALGLARMLRRRKTGE